jgi:hypothetical protein
VSPGAIVATLAWLCYAGAAAALGVYVLHFTKGKGFRRPWTAAGLFFNSIALSQTPFLFEDAEDTPGLRTSIIVTVCLLAGAGLQARNALRPGNGGGDGHGDETKLPTPGPAA